MDSSEAEWTEPVEEKMGGTEVPMVVDISGAYTVVETGECSM